MILLVQTPENLLAFRFMARIPVPCWSGLKEDQGLMRFALSF